jgi:hypothetical protein
MKHDMVALYRRILPDSYQMCVQCGQHTMQLPVASADAATATWLESSPNAHTTS